jgi:hypothetical protein
MVLAHPWFRSTGTLKHQIGKSSLQSMTSDTTTGRDTTTSQSVEEGDAGLAFGTAYSKHQNYKMSAATSL